MKTLLLFTTTLLFFNVSIMAEGAIGATQTDCSDMSDIAGADSTITSDTGVNSSGNDATN